MKRCNAAGYKVVSVIAGTALTLSGMGASASASVVADAARSAQILADSRLALDAFPEFANIADSLISAAPVILHGRLSEVAGTSMGGAVVLLSAWPSNEVVHNLPNGGRFTLTPIARAVAAPDGNYELRSALTPLLAGLVGRDGLDIEFDVFHAGRQYRYLSQVHPLGAGRWVQQLTDDLAAQEPTNGAGARNLLDVVLDNRISANLTQAPPVPHPEPDPDFPHPPRPWCSEYQKYGEQYAETVVATALSRPGVTQAVSFDHGATTTTTTGVSVGGGIFEKGGSRTRTSEFSGDYPTVKTVPGHVDNTEYRMNVGYGLYKAGCSKSYPYRGWTETWYATAPEWFPGGGRPHPATQYAPWKCADSETDPRAQEAGFIHVTTTNERAQTYRQAFNLFPTKWGSFTGEAVSGYSTKVKVQFFFGDPTRGWWCGDTGKPLADGQRVQGYEGRPHVD